VLDHASVGSLRGNATGTIWVNNGSKSLSVDGSGVTAGNVGIYTNDTLILNAPVRATGSGAVSLGATTWTDPLCTGACERPFIDINAYKFTNNYGASALRTQPGEFWSIHTNDPAVTTVGGLSPYLASYNAPIPPGNILLSSNRVFYRKPNPHPPSTGTFPEPTTPPPSLISTPDSSSDSNVIPDQTAIGNTPINDTGNSDGSNIVDGSFDPCSIPGTCYQSVPVNPPTVQPEGYAMDLQDYRLVASFINDGTVLLTNDYSMLRNFIKNAPEVVKATKFANPELSGQALDDAFDAMLAAMDTLPKDKFDKLSKAIMANDQQAIQDFLRSNEALATKAKNVLKGLDYLGKALTALSVTTETAEYLGKLGSGSANAEDFAKFAVNNGVTVGTYIIGGTAGAAGGLLYSAIPIGKFIAELREGESFSDSRQRYIDSVDTSLQSLARTEKGVIDFFYKHGDNNYLENYQLKVEYGRKQILETKKILSTFYDDLNSLGSRLASGFDFSSTERKIISEKIISEIKALDQRYRDYEAIATRLSMVGVKSHEEKIKLDTLNQLKSLLK